MGQKMLTQISPRKAEKNKTKQSLNLIIVFIFTVLLVMVYISNVHAAYRWGANWGDTSDDTVMHWAPEGGIPAEKVAIGQPLPCPVGVDCAVFPIIETLETYQKYYYKHTNGKIYAVRPMDINDSAKIIWKNTQDASIDVDYSNYWSDVTTDQPDERVIGAFYKHPVGTDFTFRPKIWIPGESSDATEDEDSHFIWSEKNESLFPIKPINRSLVMWQSIEATSDPVFQLVYNSWTANPQTHILDNPIFEDEGIELLPQSSSFNSVSVVYTENDGLIANVGNKFTANDVGYSVIFFKDDVGDTPDLIEIVKSYNLNDSIVYTPYEEAIIGDPLSNSLHDDVECGGGYVYNAISTHVESTKTEAPHDGYFRDMREGPIVPVNIDYSDATSDDLLVGWYEFSSFGSGVCWPRKRVRYFPKWPSDPDEIVIASEEGADYPNDPLIYANALIYHQKDVFQTGYNPNEEHALFWPPATTANRLYALRDDLNSEFTSESYTLVKYQDLEDASKWKFKVYNILAENDLYKFSYKGTAGKKLRILFPLSELATSSIDPGCRNYETISGPFWTDYSKSVWAKAAGLDGLSDSIEVRIHEQWPDDETGDPVCTPWLDYDNDGKGQTIRYVVNWPNNAPELRIGETLIFSKFGLPDITGQCSVEIVFDQRWSLHNNPDNDSSGDNFNDSYSVKLIDPVSETSVAIPPADIPAEIKYTQVQGKWIFTDLPFHIRTRVSYDPLGNDGNGKLSLKGQIDNAGVGEPLVLLNILTDREKRSLKAIYNSPDDNTSKWALAINTLYDKSRLQLTGQMELTTPDKALTAGSSMGSGYITLAMQANQDACKPLPVSLEVIKVSNKLHTGEMAVVKNSSPFEENVTLRHNGDFGAMPDGLTFEWRYVPDSSGSSPRRDASGDNSNWSLFNTPNSGLSQSDITIQGPGIVTLKDHWFIVRYKGFDAVGNEVWSDWTEPQLYEGWLKRVLTGINPYEQRVNSFHINPVNTVSSMISQAGKRYEGSVALNADPSNINRVGLIELYETILRRGSALSIDGMPPIEDSGINNALLLAAGRIADFYMLLGNEAFADAMDPTIGFNTSHATYGSQASSLFAFQNQVDSLLTEELDLLRGRDDSGTNIQSQPLYNRLVWNFTSGIDGGEVAYQTNYNIHDSDENGSINEYDAIKMFPQGHGDAWGHYLTAIKTYYKLLKHDQYSWIPRAEAVLVGGLPVNVDYMDERKFAKAATAKAKTGAEIVNLTYRQVYSEDPTQQTKGFKDTDSERAWGISGWSSRAGQGAYFDWVVGNAIIPDQSTVSGLSKIDRTTVTELSEISSYYHDIQSQIDKADNGINPLGLIREVVPFDIDPGQINNGKTHFEQILERAIKTVSNTKTVFDHASQSSQQLRKQQDSLEDFQNTVSDREADFNNRLIEVFGYPYAEDIGPTGAFPNDYNGPDLFHYMYVDVDDLMEEGPSNIVYDMTFTKYCEVLNNCDLSPDPKTLQFTLSRKGFGHIKPSNWTTRRAPGEIQLSRSDLFQARARLLRGIQEYKNLLSKIIDQQQIFETQLDIQSEEIQILKGQGKEIDSLNKTIRTLRAFSFSLNTYAQSVNLSANAISEGFPKVTGVIAGTSAGYISDPFAAARASVLMNAAAVSASASVLSDASSAAELLANQGKEILQLRTNIKIKRLYNKLTNAQTFAQIEELIRQEIILQVELRTLMEQLKQSQSRYMAAIARGLRIIDERTRFRTQTAADVQNYRYTDMTFRVFRNEALQQYRSQFDLAARYVYLAAKAYDYETNMLDSNTNGGRSFIESIVKNRTIGLVNNGQPVVGQGLADTLAKLDQNFDVLKGQLGFNNPQTETNRFSLRKELFRITQDTESNESWKNILEKHRVDDLWKIPEFKQYARPFAAEGAAQPGIVIPIGTSINSGVNFFGWPLGGGDSYYSPTNYSTKVRSVGVWFSNYNTLGITETPRVYLIPVGADILRTPDGNSMETRTWKVVDQKIPVPLELSGNIGNPDWIPINDTLSGVFGGIRKFSDFRAYHDSGSYTQSEMTNDSRLIGRSVWNTKWLLIIPGASLHGDQKEGLNTFIFGPKIPNSDDRTGNGVTDIKIFFQTYAYSGN